LRFGAGVKGKIGESLSYGLPTVTTKIGVEGIDLVDGRDILVGDSPEAFAERVALAYSDKSVWQSLRDNGAAAIERQFGRDATAVQIAALVEAARRVDLRAGRYQR
jgi:glycosyltransferase involved in cell wall biosynthesis